ncbi:MULTISPECIES: hypothetical protein [unclassified Wolbachia]|uniref:hypothetical protein n=1 Tax=unclassified Wolbachia TaxID=2640676 RepID=UPI003510131E
MFNKGADPNVLIQLKKLLREQEEYKKYYRYYIDNFLPALKKEVMGSEVRLPVFKNEIEQSQGSPTRRGKILGIISVITNKNSDKNHSNSTIQNQKGSRNNQTDRQGNVMGLFKKKIFLVKLQLLKVRVAVLWKGVL